MEEITVIVGDELFNFRNFNDWVNHAKTRFETRGVSGVSTLCVDSSGRICTKGKEFMRARDDDTFPVRVFNRLCDEVK